MRLRADGEVAEARVRVTSSLGVLSDWCCGLVVAANQHDFRQTGLMRGWV